MGIKTITEKVHQAIEIDIANYIGSATYLYVFGFGFHEENMRILFDNCRPNNKLESIDGTHLNLPESDFLSAISTLNNWTTGQGNVINYFELKDTKDGNKLTIKEFILKYGLQI